MTDTVDLQEIRKHRTITRGFRNWKSHFGEEFGVQTRLADISTRSVMMLAEGKGSSTFYLLDLIMNLWSLGSGFEFNDLPPKDKMKVMDSYLFLLDRLRYEWMKRLGWLEAYPSEELPLVELVLTSEELASRLQTRTPALSRQHPKYPEYRESNAFQREELVRKLIPFALRAIEDQSTTL